MTPTASKECGRTDQTKVPVSGPLLPDVESQQMAMAGVPSSVHPPHQPSFLPPRPSVARYSPQLSPFPPLEPALHMRGLPVEQRTWSGRLEDGQGAMGDPRLSLPVQAVKAVSEYQSPRRETVTHRPEDPEKGCLEESARTARQYNHHATPQLPAVKIKYIYSDVSEEDSDAEEHTVWILIYLTLFSPPLSLLISLYTLLTTTTIFLLSLLCLCCKSHTPLATQFHRYLSPPLSFQLGLIYSPTDDSSPTTKPSSCMLILVNLFGPVYAIWISVAAFVAAVFWLFAAILGDPGGRDGRNGGRAAVLVVRGWWEGWLARRVM